MARTQIQTADISLQSYPLPDYTDTKANIAALTGLVGGETAYANDTGEHGHYDAIASAWVWSNDAIGGSGVVGQVAEFVTNTKTIQAAKLIAPTGGILTLVSASAYTLTIPETMIAAGRNVIDTHTRQVFIAGSADETVLRLRAHSSMGASSYLQTWEDSSGTKLVYLKADGRVSINIEPLATATLLIKSISTISTGGILSIRTSGNSEVFLVRNDGFVKFGADLSFCGFFTSSTTYSPNFSSGKIGVFYSSTVLSSSEYFFGIINEGNQTYTSGNGGALSVKGIYAPTSGNGSYTCLRLIPTYNQTGTSSGAVVGLDYNPTATSILGSHYAALFRSGFVGIGTPTPTDDLHVVGDVRLNGKLGFYDTNPIIQPTTSIAAATFAANTSGIANDTATFDGYTIGQAIKALRNFGLLA